MIGRLQGNIIHKYPPELLIDVQGVGYELRASMHTFYQLPDVGEAVTLYTHLVVREDAQALYGFYTLDERKLFRALIKVSGIGPKIALAVFSNINPDHFVLCVSNNDVDSLVRIPGVGKKTAERLIIEMRDRLAGWQQPLGDGVTTLATGSGVSADQAIQDAVSALIALGYRPAEASKLISRVAEDGLASEELIRLALRQ